MQVWVWAATAVGEWRRWNFIGSGSSVVRRLFTRLDGVSTIPENPARSCSSACSRPCLP
ncbi:hypothetical protein BV20DRAFT_966688 [Pilatotrama ljubarskyi]|nr:hypothetical protein BV20DRAFT_966688 [Pilatotrama ljubarskyi]